MKKLFLLLLLVSASAFSQIKINPVNVGWPIKQATELVLRAMPSNVNSCKIYYCLKSDIEMLADGDISLTEQEFCDWGYNNVYIENLVLQKLNLTRKSE